MAVSRDASRVLELFHVALVKVSDEVSSRAAGWFAGVDMSSAASGALLADRLLSVWKQNAELGIAFYRLYSALKTGRTVAHPLEANARGVVTLVRLVADFERAAGVRVGVLSARLDSRVRVDRGVDARAVASVFAANRAWAVDQFERRWERRERSASAGGGPPVVAEGDRAWYAGVAQQIAANGARDVMAVVGSSEKRRVMWVRVSGTGTPCAFCAMLIGRGVGWRPYTSKGAAGGNRDYHPNCKCIPVPVFSKQDFDSDPAFTQSRQFGAEWGESGGTLAGWRKYYDGKFRRGE